MRAAALILALVLAGCASQPEVRTITHQVLVPVPCNPERPTKPTWAVDSLPLNAKIDAQMRALRADRHRAKGFIGELEVALDTCRK